MQKTHGTNTFHDFKDGNGPVPAHRHPCGGGWVADTSHVADTAYVGPNAHVFNYANVKDETVITDHANVSGYATVKDMACIKDNAVIRGLCTIEDHAQISGDVFVASDIKIGGHTILNKKQCLFNAQDCLKCPALLDDNYSATHSTPCLCCIEKLNEHKTADSDSRRSTIRSWFPQDGGINQNIECETGRPQKSRTAHP